MKCGAAVGLPTSQAKPSGLGRLALFIMSIPLAVDRNGESEKEKRYVGCRGGTSPGVVGAARLCITSVVDESPTHDARPVLGQVGTNLIREQVNVECHCRDGFVVGAGSQERPTDVPEGGSTIREKEPSCASR